MNRYVNQVKSGLSLVSSSCHSPNTGKSIKSIPSNPTVFSAPTTSTSESISGLAIVSKDDGSSFISLQKISRSKTPSIHRPGSPPVKIPSLHSESGLTLVLPDSLQNSISAQDSCNPTSGISKTTDSCTLKQSAHSGLSLAPSIGCQPNPFSIHNYMTSGLMLLPEGSSTNRPVVTPVNSTESIPQQVENHPTSDELTRIIQKPPSSRNTSIDEKASIHPCVTNLTHIDIDSSVFQSCESDALSNDLNGVGDQKWNTALSNNPTSSRMSILPETFLSRNIINKNSLLLEMESKENPTRVSRQLMEIVDDLKRFPFSIQLTPFDLKQYQQRNEQFEYIPGMSVKHSDMVISINDNKYLKERYKSVNHLSIYEMNKDMSYMVTCEVLVSNTKRYHRLYCEWRSNHRNGRVVIVDEKGSLIMLCLINRGLLQDVLIELQDGCLSSLFICNQGNCFQFISFLTLHREPWYYYSMIEYQREPLQIRMFHPENQLIYEGSVRNCLKECFPFEGEGVYYQENQAVYSGLWKDGRPETPCEDVVHVDITCNYEELFDRVLREDCNRKLNGIKRLSLTSKTTKRRWRLWACLVVVVAMVVGLLHFVFNKTEGSVCTKDHIVYMNNNHWWGCVDNHTTAGYGILYDSNKNVLFEGESYHDLYDGEGTVYEVIERWIDEESFIIKEESVKLYEGNWKAGKLMNGRIYQPSLYQQYGRDVLVYDGSFVDGLKDGDGMEYWPDGSIRFRGSYRKGEMWEGQMYSSNGMLVYEGMITGPTFEVNHLEELNRLNPFIESLILHIITEEECEVNLHNATNVKSIVISAGSLSHANRLVIENLPSLTTVQLQSQILIPHPHYSKEQYHQLRQNESRILFIQHNPQLLTLSLNGRSMTEISQLCLANNNNLESIDIDYVPEQAGISAFMLLTQFELLNLPQLLSFSLPDNFELPRVTSIGFINLTSIQTIHIGSNSFIGESLGALYIQNCPELTSVTIDEYSLKHASRILIRNVPKLTSFVWESGSFIDLSSFTHWGDVNAQLLNNLEKRYPDLRFRNVTFTYKLQEC